MATIRKNTISFRCKAFSERYPDHEANDLLEEAERIIDELEDQIEELREENRQVIDSIDQALRDPENQPSQFGTVPSEYLDRANELIDSLVRSFDYRGCDCTFNSNECCSYAVACAHLGRPLCPVAKATGEA